MGKQTEQEKNEQLLAAFQAHLHDLTLPCRAEHAHAENEWAKIDLVFDGFTATLTGTAGYALGLSFLEYETAACTMTVRLHFRDDGMYYDLYDIENLADDPVFETLVFHNVRTPQAADSAAEKLIEGLNRRSALLEEITKNDALYERLYQNKLQDMATAMNEKNSDLQSLKTAPNEAAAEACLYTLDTYLGLGALDQSYTYKQMLAKGEHEKAVAKLESLQKKQKLTVYETRFLEELRTGGFALGDETRTKAVKEIDAKKYQGVYTAVSLVVSFAVWFGLSRLCTFLGTKIAFGEAQVVASGSISVFICLLACIFSYPAIFKLLVKCTNKKHAEKIVEASGTAQRPYTLFIRFVPLVAVAVAAASLYAGSCGLALGDGEVLRRDTGQIRPQVCSYDDFTFYAAEGYTGDGGDFESGAWICVVDGGGKTVWQSDVPLKNETYDAMTQVIAENGAALQTVHDNTEIPALEAAQNEE